MPLSRFLAGIGVKSIQTGFLGNQTASVGTGEYANYHEVTLSTAVTADKCVAWVEGGAGGATEDGMCLTGSVNKSGILTAVVTAPTTLKLGNPITGGDTFQGRWYVMEFY